MKVKIKDLKSNPFRDIKNYPISSQKTESLKNSIKQTGFWDNILARQKNGNIEIAYGHHRLVVLKELFNPDDEIDIPVKDIDDSTMIRIMANENDESWGTSSKIIDETVRVAKKFLEKHPEEIQLASHGRSDQGIGFKTISEFLGGNWNETRVSYSLKRLGMIEKKELDKEAIEQLPTERSARDFARAVKKVKNITPEQQRKAAKRIIESQDFGEQSVENVVLEEKYREDKEKLKIERQKKFEDFLEDTKKKTDNLRQDIEEILNYKKDFDSDFYNQTIEKWRFIKSLDLLIFWIYKLVPKKELKYEEKTKLNSKNL